MNILKRCLFLAVAMISTIINAKDFALGDAAQFELKSFQRENDINPDNITKEWIASKSCYEYTYKQIHEPANKPNLYVARSSTATARNGTVVKTMGLWVATYSTSAGYGEAVKFAAGILAEIARGMNGKSLAATSPNISYRGTSGLEICKIAGAQLEKNETIKLEWECDYGYLALNIMPIMKQLDRGMCIIELSNSREFISLQDKARTTPRRVTDLNGLTQREKEAQFEIKDFLGFHFGDKQGQIYNPNFKFSPGSTTRGVLIKPFRLFKEVELRFTQRSKLLSGIKIYIDEDSLASMTRQEANLEVAKIKDIFEQKYDIKMDFWGDEIVRYGTDDDMAMYICIWAYSRNGKDAAPTRFTVDIVNSKVVKSDLVAKPQTRRTTSLDAGKDADLL